MAGRNFTDVSKMIGMECNSPLSKFQQKQLRRKNERRFERTFAETAAIVIETAKKTIKVKGLN